MDLDSQTAKIGRIGAIILGLIIIGVGIFMTITHDTSGGLAFGWDGSSRRTTVTGPSAIGTGILCIVFGNVDYWWAKFKERRGKK